jgi:hypothetical protein
MILGRPKKHTAESLVVPEPTAFETETINKRFDGYKSQVLIKYGRDSRENSMF